MNEETTTSLIDTALASGSASALDPEERRLQELVLAVRGDAPVPDPDFRLRMDARVAAGFPRRPSAPGAALPSRIRDLALRPRLAVLGAVASLLIGLAVVISLGGNDRVGTSGSSGSSPGGSPSLAQAEKSAPPAGAGGASTRAVAPDATVMSAPAPSIAPGAPPLVEPPGAGTVVGGSNRQVERSAALTLAAPKDKLSEAGNQVVAVTNRYRGFVMSSSVTSATGDQAGGSFDLRIPARNLQLALRDLSQIASVQSRTENTNDITASFVSVRTRLEELGALRASLLGRLAKAKTDREAGALRSRLRSVNAQLDAETRALAQLRRRTDYAAVSVALVPKNGSAGGGGIGSGARDLRDSLVDAANIALRVLGVALPIGIVVGLLWAANSVVTRRRREAALDARL